MGAFCSTEDIAEQETNEFVTEAPKTELKRFIWTIKDFRVNLENCNNRLWIEFDIGASIGLPSKWKISAYSYPVDKGPRIVELRFSRSEGEPAARRFSCTVAVKNQKFKLHQGAPSVKFTVKKIQKELVIHVEFVLRSPTVVTTKGMDLTNTLIGGSDVLDRYEHLLTTGDNSDFEIQVKDGENRETILVHKAILSARSSVFKTMLETDMQERKNGTLIIEDLSPECVKIMLKYIYTGNLDNDWIKIPEQMVKAADKYNLPLLLEFLNQRLHCVCTPDNAWKILLLAKLHRLDIAVRNVNKVIASSQY